MDLMRRAVGGLCLGVCLVAGLAAASTGQPAPSAPLLRNAGFEEGLSGWTPGAWRNKPGYLRVASDTSAHHGGAAAVLLQHLQPNDSYLSQRIPVEAHTLYHISAWVKTDHVTAAEAGRVGANLSILDTRIVSHGIDGTQDWQPVELWFKTGRESATIALACRLGYWSSTVAGTAWFDDVSIEVADQAPAGAIVQSLDVNAGLFHQGSWSYWGLLAALIAAVAWLEAPSPRPFSRWGAFSVFLLTAAAYAISAWPWLGRPSRATHYVYLADAFLHRQLYLAASPPRMHDYVLYHGHVYVQQGPLPAVLMMPLAAIWGLRANDVLFTIAIGACNAALMWAALQRLLPDRSAADRLWLTLLFALGTPHWYLSVMGRVWHTASVCAVTCLLLALWETAGRKRWALVGLWVGLAFLCRPIMLGTGVVFVIRMVQEARAQGWTPSAAGRRLGAFAAPLVAVMGVWMLYNTARFGSPMETGFSSIQEAAALHHNHIDFGLFHPHFIPRNAWYGLMNPLRPISWFPFFKADPEGNSLFMVTPAFLYLVRSFQAAAWCIAAWPGVAVMLGALLCYYATGWTQFGYRYSTDVLPLLIVLTAVGMGRRLSPLAKGLIGLSVLINAVGVQWFYAFY